MSDGNGTALAEAPRPQRAVARPRTAEETKQHNLKALLEASKDRIAAVLPKHLTADRLLKIALLTATQNRQLLNCDPMSILRSVMTAAQLGLDVGGALGSAYLVAFKDQCQLIIGYRGLIDLARRSGQIVSIEARVVRRNDVFDLDYSIDGVRLVHKPALDRDPGELRLVYGVATLKDGGRQFELMTRDQIDAIRRRSRSGDNGPWKTDYEEMARKTVVKRLSKYLPISVELADAITSDNRDEFGSDTFDGIVADNATGAATLNNRLKQAEENSRNALPPPPIDGEIVPAADAPAPGGSEPDAPAPAEPEQHAGGAAPEQSQAQPGSVGDWDYSTTQTFEASFIRIGTVMFDMTEEAARKVYADVKMKNATNRLGVREAVIKAWLDGRINNKGEIVEPK